MNNHRSFRSSSFAPAASLAIAMAVLFFTTTVFASTPQGTFDRTLQVSGPVDLEVLTRSGDITVRSGPAGSVTIRGKIFVSDRWNILPGIGIGGNKGGVQEIEQNPPIRQEGNSIHIDYVNVHDISVDYEITVPEDTTLRARSGSGDQEIKGLRGNADLVSGSGDLKLEALTGTIHLQTGSGDVRARQISGPVTGGTGSGNIEVEETAAGDIDVHTGSGNITTRGVQGAFRAEAGSGDITAEGTQSGSWDIKTGSGNVHVRLPSNAAFDAKISTSSGTVDIDAPVEMTVQGRVQETRKSINGKVRGGGPLLAVRTGSGDIHVE